MDFTLEIRIVDAVKRTNATLSSKWEIEVRYGVPSCSATYFIN